MSQDLYAEFDRMAAQSHETIKKTEARSNQYGELPKGLRKSVNEILSVNLAKSQKGQLMIEVRAQIVLDGWEIPTKQYAGTNHTLYYVLAPSEKKTMAQKLDLAYNDLKLIGFSQEIAGAHLPHQSIPAIQEALKKNRKFFFLSTSSSRTRDDGTPFVTVGKGLTQVEVDALSKDGLLPTRTAPTASTPAAATPAQFTQQPFQAAPNPDPPTEFTQAPFAAAPTTATDAPPSGRRPAPPKTPTPLVGTATYTPYSVGTHIAYDPDNDGKWIIGEILEVLESDYVARFADGEYLVSFQEAQPAARAETPQTGKRKRRTKAEMEAARSLATSSNDPIGSASDPPGRIMPNNGYIPGARVNLTVKGVDYPGTVDTVTGKAVRIHFDDGETVDIENDNPALSLLT